MLFTKTDDIILSDKRLTAREHIEMSTELLSLGNNAVHFIICKILLVAVFCSPAALTLEIAGTCGVYKDLEGYVTVILFSVCSYFLCSEITCLKTERHKHMLEHSSVNITQNAHCKLSVNIIRISGTFLELLEVFGRKHITDELFGKIYYIDKCILRLFVDIFENTVKSNRCSASYNFLFY